MKVFYVRTIIALKMSQNEGNKYIISSSFAYPVDAQTSWMLEGPQELKVMQVLKQYLPIERGRCEYARIVADVNMSDLFTMVVILFDLFELEVLADLPYNNLATFGTWN